LFNNVIMNNKTDTFKQDTAWQSPLPEHIDRSREQQWLAEHSEEFAGQWVALDGNRLLSHGNNAHEVYEEARRSGVKRPLVVQVEKVGDRPFGGW
jgi:hypothetical protein